MICWWHPGIYYFRPSDFFYDTVSSRQWVLSASTFSLWTRECCCGPLGSVLYLETLPSRSAVYSCILSGMCFTIDVTEPLHRPHVDFVLFSPSEKGIISLSACLPIFLSIYLPICVFIHLVFLTVPLKFLSDLQWLNWLTKNFYPLFSNSNTIWKR